MWELHTVAVRHENTRAYYLRQASSTQEGTGPTAYRNRIRKGVEAEERRGECTGIVER
jgi:hypothetical protein